MALLPRTERTAARLCGVRSFAIAWLASVAITLGACAHTPRAEPAARDASACAWTSPPVPFYQSHDTLYQAWTIPAARADGSWAPADVPALTAFRRAVADSLAHAGVASDPESVTRRVTAYYGAKPDRDAQTDADNGRQVLAGTAGTIRPLTCIEALVLDYQARRFSMTRQPTEFHVFLLRRDGADATTPTSPLLVYFAASSAPWPPSVGRLVAALEPKVREGWRVIAHMHNHPFYLDHLRPDSAGRPTADIAGGMAPSSTDVQFYRAMRADLGLASARVTNGFATLEMPAAAFDRLHARGEGASP
jgi:hypothetical protein